MKYLQLLITAIILPIMYTSTFAQTPEAINYQAALRNNDGSVMSETTVKIRFTITDAATGGTELYKEEHTSVTSELGLVNLSIGGGDASVGDFENIDWSNGGKFLKTEVKQGSGSFINLGTQKLVSVPYALHAKNTSQIAGIDISATLPTTGQVLKYDGTDWIPAPSTPTGTAGGDLTGTYPNPTIGAAKVSSSKIANNAITTAKLNNAAVTAAKLNGMGASNGQILKYNGTAWAPANEHFVLSGAGDTLKRMNGIRLNLGWDAVAAGNKSTAIGQQAQALGTASNAIGFQSTASGNYSTAIGILSIASGANSIALGYSSIASGHTSTSLGLNTTSSGSFSTAIGNYVSTNSTTGSCVIGDYNTDVLNSTVHNQMSMRFAGGYRFFSNSSMTSGVQLAAGGNSWSTISDSTKKEHFKYIDGNAVLSKIGNMKIGSWNYKGQDKALYRHYGPMAQEFYAYFGNDGIGIIGNDTTIASADIDGVMMIAIQALIKENEQLKADYQLLKIANSENEKLKMSLQEVQSRLSRLELISTHPNNIAKEN